jgi:hypothetical protein
MKFNPHAALLIAGMGLLMASEAIYLSRKGPIPSKLYWCAGFLAVLAGVLLFV